MPYLRLDAAQDLARILGFESGASLTADQQADILKALNYAQQTLWESGADYFTRTPLTVSLSAGQNSIALDATVQSVLGPVRMADGRTLRALTSRSELDNFGLTYLGQSAIAVAPALPLAYYIENLNNTSGADTKQMLLHLVPGPLDADTCTVEGVAQVTRLVTADLTATTALPVAQHYVETLFLPLARKDVTRSLYFSRRELQAKIDADFAEAQAALKRAGGFPSSSEKPGGDERREVAA